MTDEEKKMRQAILFGAQLLIDNGMGDWKIGIHNMRRALATCHAKEKTIRYSKHFIKIAAKEDFEGVTLHEIAHAIVGVTNGHNLIWRRKCEKLVSDIVYARAILHRPINLYKYTLICPECDTKNYANVRTDYICNRCKTNGKQVRFLYEENVPQVNLW